MKESIDRSVNHNTFEKKRGVIDGYYEMYLSRSKSRKEPFRISSNRIAFILYILSHKNLNQCAFDTIEFKSILSHVYNE